MQILTNTTTGERSVGWWENEGWISVNDRLPEPDVKVLTFARFKGDGSWFMDISSWTGVTNHGIPEFWGYGPEMVVTHWMPMPDIPDEDKF